MIQPIETSHLPPSPLHQGGEGAAVEKTLGYKIVTEWLSSKGLTAFTFQQQTWQHIINNESGLVNAPTGCGKTFSVFLGAIIDFINHHPDNYITKKHSGLQLIWITPLRALGKDIGRAMEEVIEELGMHWKIGIRNGDTDTAERQRQKRQMPEVLIITPESLHLLLAQKGYPEIFSSLKIIAVDEWHELLGSKRGVQVELAISRIVNCQRLMVNSQWSMVNGELYEKAYTQINSEYPGLCIWGISATIGNLEQAKEVLLSPLFKKESSMSGVVKVSPTGGVPIAIGIEGAIVKAELQKAIEVESIFP